MKTRLLKQDTYEELLEGESLEEVVASLSKTPYKPQIDVALSKYRGFPCVVDALGHHFSYTMDLIRSFFEGPPRRLIDTVLARWDVFNIKTILRGQIIGISPQEIIDAVVPAGGFDEAELEEIAQQADLEASAALIATRHAQYARPLAQVMGAYEEHQDLSLLELALDKSYYDRVMRRTRGIDNNAVLVRELIGAEIDLTNIMMVFRLCGAEGIGEELQEKYGADNFSPLLIASGKRLSFQRLSQLDPSATREEALRQMAGTPYARILTSLDGALPRMERELERYVTDLGISMFFRDPLGIAIPLGYIWAKENEMRNLRIIARCKARGLSAEQIREELILVPRLG